MHPRKRAILFWGGAGVSPSKGTRQAPPGGPRTSARFVDIWHKKNVLFLTYYPGAYYIKKNIGGGEGIICKKKTPQNQFQPPSLPPVYGAGIMYVCNFVCI